MFKRKKRKLGESEDKNFAKYSERIFSKDEGLKDKAHQDLVVALEDGKPFYLSENTYFRCYKENNRNTFILEFYKSISDVEPFKVILERDEFCELFEYVVSVREDIFSDITVSKDMVSINMGRNLTGTYWFDVVNDQKIMFRVSGERTIFIKLVHALFYAKHYSR